MELLGLLRPGDGRRSEDGASQATQERTSVHKSPRLAASCRSRSMLPFLADADARKASAAPRRGWRRHAELDGLSGNLEAVRAYSGEAYQRRGRV